MDSSGGQQAGGTADVWQDESQMMQSTFANLGINVRGYLLEDENVIFSGQLQFPQCSAPK